MNDPMNESMELQEEQFEYDFENPPAAQTFNNVPQPYAPPAKVHRCSCSVQRDLRGSQPVSSSGRWIRENNKLILLDAVPGGRG